MVLKWCSGPRRMCCNRSVVISWPSRDAVGIFWKPTFHPNHRARNPHPGDGPEPLLGPRIFRALRLLGSILKRFGGALGDAPSFVEMARAVVAIGVTNLLLVACQDYEYLFAQTGR